MESEEPEERDFVQSDAYELVIILLEESGIRRSGS